MNTEHEEFAQAMREGDAEKVRQMAQEAPELLRERYTLYNPFSKEPYHVSCGYYAVEHIQPAVVQALADLHAPFHGTGGKHQQDSLENLVRGALPSTIDPQDPRAYETLRVLLNQHWGEYLFHENPNTWAYLTLSEAFEYKFVMRMPFRARALLDHGVDHIRFDPGERTIMHHVAANCSGTVPVWEGNQLLDKDITFDQAVAYIETLASVGMDFTRELKKNHTDEHFQQMQSVAFQQIRGDTDRFGPDHFDRVLQVAARHARKAAADMFSERLPEITDLIGDDGTLKPETRRMLNLGAADELFAPQHWEGESSKARALFQQLQNALPEKWKKRLEEEVDVLALDRGAGKPAAKLGVAEMLVRRAKQKPRE